MARWILPLLLLALGACSSDASDSPDTSSDGSGATDTTVDGSATDTAADGSEHTDPPGTRALLDTAALGEGMPSDRWFDFPYPSDLRRTPDGHLSLATMPNPRNLPLLRGIIQAAEQETGFPVNPTAWFRFSAPVAAEDGARTLETVDSSRAILIALNGEADAVGRPVPIVAQTLAEDLYIPSNLLALAPVPGFVLAPDTTYAFVIFNTFGTAEGGPLEPSPLLGALARGDSPAVAGFDGAAIAANYAPLWPVLSAAGYSASTVVAATVFTTGDVTREMFGLSEQVRANFDLDLSNLAVDPDDGATHEGFCELTGTMEVPEFQEGTPPYNTGGLFVRDGAGNLIEQRRPRIPFVVNLPAGPMPTGGYPLSLFFHGSGGLSSQVVDRGTDGTVAQGPAWVLAHRGIGTAASALPVNPERIPGASDIAYLNFANLRAFRDTFRQGILEQRLFLDALLALRIDPATVAACPGLSLPDGEIAYRFADDKVLAMGHSMGGMYVNLIAPVEPRIRAVVPTGAGGFWTYFILQTQLVPGAANTLKAILGSGPLVFTHPALGLVQTAWETAEPMIGANRLAARPLAGHPARPIYEPVGQGDYYFPTPIFDAIALSMENQQAGELVWPTMQSALTLKGLDGLLAYPIVNNRPAPGGGFRTGVVVQYPGDGIHDPHNIFQHDARVKHQYACFFSTFLRDGAAKVVAPVGLDAPCD